MEIIVLSYNHPNLTRGACLSILGAHPGQLLTLVHNGSRPDVVAELKAEFPEINHLILPVNLGFTGGANAGLQDLFSRSPWALFYTNDLDVASVPHELPSKAGLYFPLSWRRKVGGKIDSIGGVFNPLLGKLAHCRSEEAFKKRRLFTVPYATGVAFLMHKEVFEKVGDFDESLHTYWEDVDLSMRAHQAGVSIEQWRGWEICHKIGRTCHKEPLYTKELFWRNRKTLMKRYRFFFLRNFKLWNRK